jgi:hypothetical protein
MTSAETDPPGLPPPAAPLEVSKLRTAYLQARKPAAPSSAGRASELGKHQQKSEKMIPCNRPYGAAATIPVTLLHLVFGQFKDDCETLTPTKDDNALVLKLQKTLSDFHPTEDDQADAIWEVLKDAGIILTQAFIDGSQFKTDGRVYSICLIQSYQMKEENTCLSCMNYFVVFAPYPRCLHKSIFKP